MSGLDQGGIAKLHKHGTRKLSEFRESSRQHEKRGYFPEKMEGPTIRERRVRPVHLETHVAWSG